MPRIPPSLYYQLPKPYIQLSKLLLPTCRTLEQTSNELRWIQSELPSTQWHKACQARSQKVPLQYILGSQPFGSIDIKCKPQVLIPRWETEEFTIKIINMIRKIPSVKTVVDICTGSGCIPLLIASEMPQMDVIGYDISEKAIKLSRLNSKENGIDNVKFELGDVFNKDILANKSFDIVISNPPYIPLKDYMSSEVDSSVRKYEPRIALVGDLEFYKALVDNVIIPSGCNAFVLELGYIEQVKYTQQLLDDRIWGYKSYNDSAENIRCIIGWKKGTEYEIFKDI